jgi:hypothetical protein
MAKQASPESRRVYLPAFCLDRAHPGGGPGAGAGGHRLSGERTDGAGQRELIGRAGQPRQLRARDLRRTLSTPNERMFA